MILSRLHPIEEAVRSRPREIEWVLLDAGRRERRLAEIARLCRESGIPLRRGDRAALLRIAPDNQGAVARLAVRGYLPEEEALQGEPGRRFLLRQRVPIHIRARIHGVPQGRLRRRRNR